MILIRNKTDGPTQLVVRSFARATDDAVAFTCLNIPGRNTYFCEEERMVEVYLDRSKKDGLIDWKRISKKEFEKLYNPRHPRQNYIPGYKEKSISEEI